MKGHLAHKCRLDPIGNMVQNRIKKNLLMAMRKKNIEDKSVRYYLLWLLARLYFYLYHKKIIVYGKENIPADCPIIFAPNHQNAVIDPLAVLFTQKKATVFLARADVFKGRFLVRLLTFLKILPVYRQRDGIEKLAKNEEIFNTTVRVLKNKVAVCLMAEGNHGNQNRLRSLVKGIFRIAFSAQDSLEDKSKGVRIVPVGLYYEDYSKFNQRMVVNYGKPIAVEEFYPVYKEKPALAINKLKDKLAESMSRYMIDIKSDEYYESINFVQREFSKYKKLSPGDQSRYFVQKELTAKFNSAIENKSLFLPQFHFFVRNYLNLLEKHQLRDWVVAKKKLSSFNILINIILLLVLIPFFITGMIANWLPYRIPIIPTKKIKDRQFHSSVKYVIAMLIFTLYYLILGVAVGLIFKSLYIAILFLVISPIFGFLALHTYYVFKKTMAKIRFKKLVRKKHEDALSMIQLRKKIKLITELVLLN